MIRQKIMQLHSSKQAQKSRKKGLIELRLPLLLRKKGLIELRLPLLLRIKGVIRPRLTSLLRIKGVIRPRLTSLLRIKGVIRPRLTQLLRIKMSDHTATNPIAPDKKNGGSSPELEKESSSPLFWRGACKISSGWKLSRGEAGFFLAGRGRIYFL